MKINKEIIIFVFFILTFINTFYYIKGIKLANEIYQFENEINKLDIENKKIEINIAKMDNLDFLSSQAAELGLKYPLKFWYLQPNKYAFYNLR